MKVVLIAGKARSGKDSFATFLEEELKNKNIRVCRLGFGDYIKYYTKKYFGWSGNDEDKPRDFLNYLGTDIIRGKVDKYFNVKRIVDDIKVLSYFFDVAIISDVREEIEIEEIKKNYEALTIKIVRDNFVTSLSLEQQKAYTEVALDNYTDFDYVIHNDKDLDNLKTKATEFASEVIK